MTKIPHRDNPVYHETRLLQDGRAIIVAETPNALLLRLKGTRQVLSLPWSKAFLVAATMEADLHRIHRKMPVRRGALS